MAGVNPMSLNFKSELDNNEFRTGANELQKALQSLRSRLVSFSGVMNSAFDFQKFDDDMGNAARSAEEFEDNVREISDTFNSIDMADTFVQAQSILGDITKMVEEFSKRTYEMEDGTVVIGEQTEAYKVMQESLQELIDSMDEVDEAYKTNIGNQEDLDFFAKSFDETIAKIGADLTLKQTAGIVDELKRKLKELGSTQFVTNDGMFSGKQTDLYKDMREELDMYKEHLEKLSHSEAWNQLEENWKKMPTLSGTVSSAVKGASDKISSVVKGIKNSITGTAQKAFEGLAGAGTKLSFTIKKGMEDPIGSLDRFGLSAASAADKLAMIPAIGAVGAVNAVKSLGKSAVDAGANLLKMGIPKVVSGLKSLAGGALNATKNLHKMALNSTVKVLKSIGSHAASAATNLGRMVTNKVVTGFKKLTNGLLGMGRTTKSFGRTAQMTFGRFLAYTIGVKSLAQVFQKLKSSVQQGFNELLKVDVGLADTVDGLDKSIEQLKVNFAAAFLPIVEIAVPAIQKIINVLSQAVSAIGQFVAAMTGQTTYKQAIANQEALAEATTGAASAYTSAAKKAREEKKSLQSFDELHIIDKEEEKPKYGLVDVPIDPGFSELADKLKEMWELADFTELGRMLGEGLKHLLDSIPWDKIKELARKLGKSLATLLNGFMEVPGLFYTLGKTLAEAINTIFELLNAFVNNLHWDSLGKAIKDFILGLLNNIDWPLIFDTFAKLGAGIGTALEHAFDNPEIWEAIFTTISNAVRALLLFFYNLISVPDWASIARNIGIGLNKGVEEFPWELLSATIAEALNSLFEFVYNLVTTFDFYGLGERIGQSFMDALINTDWALGGAALAEGINGIFDLIYGVVSNIQWDVVGQKIKDGILGFIDNIDWPTILATLGTFGTGIATTLETSIGDPAVWQGVFNALSHALGAIVLLIHNFVTTPNWGEIAQAIGNGLNDGINNFPWGLLADTLSGAFNMVLDLVYNFLTTFDFYSFAHQIGKSLSDAVGNVNWEEFGAAFAAWVNGFRDTISGFMEGTDWKALGVAVVDAVKGYFGELDVAKWSEELTNIWEGLYEFLTGILQEVDWGALPGQIVEKIKEFFGSFNWEEIAEQASNLIGLVLGAAASFLWSALAGIGETAYAVIYDVVDGGFQGVIDWFFGVEAWIYEHMLQPFENAFRSIFTGDTAGLDTLGTDIMEGIGSGIISWISGIGAWLNEHVFTPIFNGIKGIFGIASPATTMVPLGFELLAGFGEGIIGWITGIPGWLAQNVGGPIIGGIKALFGIGQGDPALEGTGAGAIEGMKNGMTNALSNAFSWVKGNVTDKIINPIKEGLGTNGNGDSTVTKEYGNEVVSGLKAGMDGAANALKNTGEGVAKAVITPIQSGLGIAGGTASTMLKFGTVAVESLKNGISKGVNAIVTVVKGIATTILATFKGIDWNALGTFLISGFTNGVKNGVNAVLDIIKNLITGIVNVFKEVKWDELGSFTITGVVNGIKSLASAWVEMWKLILNAAIEVFKVFDWTGLGTKVIGGIASGIKTGVETVVSTVKEFVSSISEAFSHVDWALVGSTILSAIAGGLTNEYAKQGLLSAVNSLGDSLLSALKAIDWGSIGTYMLQGIQNGLYAGWDWIYTTVTDVARNLLDAAKAALGIASPSKEFAWVGEMITRGLADGIDDSQQMAVDTAEDLAQAVLDGANGIKPAVTMEPAINGLDNVLSTFSDKVAGSFSELIARMEQIAAGSSFYIPAAAAGTLAPFASNVDGLGGEADTMTQILDMLTMMNYSKLTRGDIQEIMERLFRDYMNITFVMGDEEVARHANAGNDRISRRFSPVGGV